MARGVAWVAPENLHITLKFLGAVEESRLPAVEAGLAEVAALSPAFAFTVHGLGAFPTATRPRVVWAGVAEGEAPMATLAAAVDDALAPVGFPAETRGFSPHVTLGRVREPRRDPGLARALGERAAARYGRTLVERVILMQSDLSPRGARYRELAAWPLGRPGA